MNKKLLKKIIISVLLSLSAFTVWSANVEIPKINKFTKAENNAEFIEVQPAINPVAPGETLYIKVLAPPGTKEVNISAESGQLQGNADGFPVMGGFSEDPGILCTTKPTKENPTPCGSSLSISNLNSKSASINVGLYNGEALKEARYVYFVLYQQPRAIQYFKFKNFNLLIYIENVDNIYNNWVDQGRPLPGSQTDFNLSITEPVNGKVTIDQKDCPTECTHTYPADTEVTLIAEATTDGYIVDTWDCKAKGDAVIFITNTNSDNNKTSSVTFKMDGHTTCSAIFSRLPPITLKIDPPSNGIIVNYNNKKLNIFYHENKNILCSKDLFEDCSAEFIENQQVILLTIPLPGYKLKNWDLTNLGTEATEAYGNSNTSHIKIINIKANDNNLIEIPTATFTNLAE